MKKLRILIFVIFITFGCSTAYKATPLPFKMPSSYQNSQNVSGAIVAAKAYSDDKEARQTFGFDIRKAGMTPVQVIFDNQSTHPLEINIQQTFLVDSNNNVWPILSNKVANERATKYAQTNDMIKTGAYNGFLGATAGAIVGAAVGIVSGENVATAAGKGAAMGAAAGAVLGGASKVGSEDAQKNIIDDLYEKSMQNKAVEPKNIAHGFIFFPGEAVTAKQLKLNLIEKDTGKIHSLTLDF